MGSMIYLSVGRLEIDWGKNWGFGDHSALFQASDLTDVPYYYVDDDDPHYVSDDPKQPWKIITGYKPGLSKPLCEVIDRIKLLGHSLGA